MVRFFLSLLLSDWGRICSLGDSVALVPTLPSFSFDPVSAPVIVKSEPAPSPSPSPPQISNEKEQEKENIHTSLSLDKITPAAPRVFRSSNKCSTIADALPRAINAAGRKVYADILVEVRTALYMIGFQARFDSRTGYRTADANWQYCGYTHDGLLHHRTVLS